MEHKVYLPLTFQAIQALPDLVPTIDVSKWNASNQAHPPVKHFRWDLARSKGILVAIIKATQGKSTDPEYEHNQVASAEVGIARSAYAFYERSEPPAEQAAYFYGVVRDDQLELEETVDLEVTRSMKILKQKYDLAKVRIFCSEVMLRTGRRMLTYTNPDTWYSWVSGTERDRVWFAENTDLFLARWGAINPPPLIPWERWVVHQHSANGNGLGAEYGSMGSVDIDLDWVRRDWLARQLEQGQLPDQDWHWAVDAHLRDNLGYTGPEPQQP